MRMSRRPKQLDQPSTTKSRGLTVILKPTNRCNMACTFCSIGASGKDTMSPEDFELFASELERIVALQELSRLTVTFHGGEPTVLGPRWIDEACLRLRRIPMDVSLGMQSNLYSISDEMIDVIRKHDIRVGTSIDPLFGQRRETDGGDGFERWVKNHEKMSKAGFNTGAIFVVTRDALTRVRELYAAFESLNAHGDEPIGIQLNPIYTQGKAIDSPEMLLEPHEFGQFLIDFWHVWEESGRSINVTPIRAFVQHFDEGRENSARMYCSFENSCAGTHVGVDHNLDIAGCGRRLDSGAILGNLHDRHIDEILSSAVEQSNIELRAEALRKAECSDCRFFDCCHGGCPDDAEVGAGDLMGRHYWCESYKMFFEALESRPVSAVQGHGPRRAGVKPSDLRTTIRLEVGPEIAASAGLPGHIHKWVLPTEDGAILKFDSQLERVLDRQTDHLRLWVHHRHVRTLTLWRDVLRDPRVCIVLFEGGDELAKSLNVLNALEATIALDVASILDEDDGYELLCQVIDRFLTDPLWKSSINPFSGMLLNAVDGKRAPLMTVWGLRRGAFDVSLGSGVDQDCAEPIPSLVRAMCREGGRSVTEWEAANGYCLRCERVDICGGRFAVGDDQGCIPQAKLLIDRIWDAAEKIRSDLDGAGEDTEP